MIASARPSMIDTIMRISFSTTAGIALIIKSRRPIIRLPIVWNTFGPVSVSAEHTDNIKLTITALVFGLSLANHSPNALPPLASKLTMPSMQILAISRRPVRSGITTSAAFTISATITTMAAVIPSSITQCSSRILKNSSTLERRSGRIGTSIVSAAEMAIKPRPRRSAAAPANAKPSPILRNASANSFPPNAAIKLAIIANTPKNIARSAATCPNASPLPLTASIRALIPIPNTRMAAPITAKPAA